MNTSQPTYSPRAAEVKRSWRVIDAADRPLGRVASEAAHILRGKDKPSFTPHMDVGDFVVIVNAAKIRVSGAKQTDKTYYSHSGYPGGLKALSFDRMMEKSPRRVMEYAVWGMLPKGPLGRRLLRKLKVYAEDSHPHGAQIKELSRPDRVGKPKKKPRPTKAERAARRAEMEAAEAAAVAAEEMIEEEAAPEVEEAVAEAAPVEETEEAPEATEAPKKPARKRQPAKKRTTAKKAAATAEVEAAPSTTAEASAEAPADEEPQEAEEAVAEAPVEEAEEPAEAKKAPKKPERKRQPAKKRTTAKKAKETGDAGESESE